MSGQQLMEVADNADLIVSGYAFTASDDSIRVLNLESPSQAALLSSNGLVIETTMDDAELAIVLGHLNRNRSFLMRRLYSANARLQEAH